MSQLAPWLQRQCGLLLNQPGHAWLLQGASGLGQYGLALALVRAWLCEHPSLAPDAPAGAPGPGQACGSCSSCRALEICAHADVCVLMPESHMLELGWPLDEKTQAELDGKKRKPSREIRIEALREAIEFTQRSSVRGRGRAVLIYPAERMNHISANALLKTLEEPPGAVRFVLASEAAHLLLPTIRSRCLTHTMAWPEQAEALAWLQAQGLTVPDAQVLLRAAGGRPEDALQYPATGRGPQPWGALPKAMQQGDAAVVAQWNPAHVLQALLKLCHDLLLLHCGEPPRFFAPSDLPPPPSRRQLSDWQQELFMQTRSVQHPYNSDLMIEALVSRAQCALN